MDHIKLARLPESVDGCEECIASGQSWAHLRICLECGYVGCSEDSPGAHAKQHAVLSGHPIVRSLEPDEEWGWCYLDGIGMLLPQVTGESVIRLSPSARQRRADP
jgi:Zn-finger in ubiquitin-hydrolases and other protein